MGPLAPKVPHYQPAGTVDHPNDADFAALVAQGDRDRAAGRISAAATAYARAMKLRRDPLVAGRLGVLLVKLHEPAKAADLLLDALKRAQAMPDERKAFFDAYEEALTYGCWVDVVISHAGTDVTFDNKARNQERRSAFSMFALEGEHQLRARLDGYKDAVATFTAKKGEHMLIRLTLEALPIAPKVEPNLPHEPERGPLFLPDEPAFDEEPIRREPIIGGVEGEQKPPKPRGSLGGGAVVVLGVASWSPAVGVVLEGRLQVHEHVSLGLEGRAAWLTSGVEGRQISAMTAGGILSACGHVRWFFGCGLGHVGVINVEHKRASYEEGSDNFVTPGLGGRVGVKFHVGRAFSVEGSLDALGLASGLKIVAGQTVLVQQPPVMLGAQLTGAWEL